MRHRLQQLFVGVDQLINVLLGGWADETVSARAWRLRHKPRWRRVQRLIDRIFFWERGHCERAHRSEQTRRHLPPEYRFDGEPRSS